MNLLIAVLYTLTSFFLHGKNTTVPQQTSPVLHNTVIAAKPAIPQRLIIPQIQMDTKICEVDLNKENLVDVPLYDVGWYRQGAKPGHPGNAVLQGHSTNLDLTPGIFRNLSVLETGDDIYIVDSEGNKHHYRVVEKELVDVMSFSVEKVYGSSSAYNLNLITCSGDYDTRTKDYTMRTIIYSRRVEDG
ncbi:MAG: class F sortase [Patescibacteria group bacterium]